MRGPRSRVHAHDGESAPGLERWLRSPWRRRTLIALGVVTVAAASTFVWLDAARSFDRTTDPSFRPWEVFARRLWSWSLWGVLVEPIAWFAGRLARWLPVLALQLAVHAGLAVAATSATTWVETTGEEWLFPPPPRPDWMGRRGPDGPSDRTAEEGERAAPPPRPPDEGPRPEDAGQGPGAGSGAGSSAGPGPSPGPSGAPGRGGGRFDRFRSARDLARSRFTWSRRVELGALVYFALVALGTSVRTFLSQRAQERETRALELRAARLEADLSRARLASLESQLRPHFLFNALHGVGGLVRAERRDEAVSTLSALGELLRTTMDRQGEDEVPIHEELSLVERYLDIERIRLGDRLQTLVESEPGVGRALVPTLLLLPLVENAVRYAIAPRPAGGLVEVRAMHVPEGVAIVVQDDGPGFPPEVLAHGSPTDGRNHIGLKNSAERLAALHGDGARFELSNRAEGGARVRIVIPVPKEPTP